MYEVKRLKNYGRVACWAGDPVVVTRRGFRRMTKRDRTTVRVVAIARDHTEPGETGELIAAGMTRIDRRLA